MLLSGGPSSNGFGHSSDYLNQLVMSYSPGMIANRGLMISVAVVCLIFLYLRFAIAERARNVESLSTLNLSTVADRVYYEAPGSDEIRPARLETREKVVLPSTSVGEGFSANLKKLIAASGVEFRLLRAERSLIVLVPLAIFVSTFELAFYNVVREVSYSATYASATANALMFFLLGMTVFYVGEAMHRDREVRIQPVLWSTAVPNYVLLLSKFFAALLLNVALAAV